MHRFGIDQIGFIRKMHRLKLFASVSVGVNGDSQAELESMLEAGAVPEYVTIDVANAWSEKVRQKIGWVKKNMPEVFLIVGNVATWVLFANMLSPLMPAGASARTNNNCDALA